MSAARGPPPTWRTKEHGMHRNILALALALGSAGAMRVLAPDDARAQCSIGDYLGTCTTDIGYAGCCPSATRIQWCEGALLCGIDCSGNQGHEDCCSPSGFAGCESSEVEACVCAQDDWCCDTLFGSWDAFCVDIATNDCAACDAGGAPPVYCGWLDGEGFYDCRETPSADPTGVSAMACGASCTPVCGGRSCGSDGCGGSCGQCGANATCNATGQCIGSCTPQCAGKACGSDGCGGTCGQCTSVQSCVAGQCEEPVCVPQCTGKECGANGCGGACGVCAGAQTCNGAGQCVPPACVPACGSRACGDDGCAGICGACAIGESCQVGACVAACAPSCGGKVCGDDGCGGSCGTCGANEACEAGACASACSCEGRECGDDGCGRVCGYCIAGSECNIATHVCDKGATPTNPGPSDASTEPSEVIGAENCPLGQVWSAYARACVVDLNGSVNTGRNDSGCAGGAPSAWVSIGLSAVFGMRRRRSRVTGR